MGCEIVFFASRWGVKKRVSQKKRAFFALFFMLEKEKRKDEKWKGQFQKKRKIVFWVVVDKKGLLKWDFLKN